MTLVERFIEINGWSTSRKTALASGLILPACIVIALAADSVNSHLPWLDAQRIHAFFWLGNGVFGIIFLLSISVALLGREGRWTFFLLVIPLGALIAGLIWLFGFTSSGLLALYPCVVMAGTLLYGVRGGGFIFLYGLGLTVLVLLLQTNGVIPFAPVILDRSLDVQRSGSYVAIVAFAVVLLLGILFVVTTLLLETQRLQKQNLDRSARLIRRYVPSQVADAIMSGREETTAHHERRKLTLFFSDLVGFTDISEELEPEDLSRLLNEYFSEMTRIAEQHGGTVDELAGDAILIFFGAPNATDDKDHALRAVRMAAEMQQAMVALNAKWKSAGIDVTLKVRMGLNTGVVTIGNFGSKERMKYTALGKHVNVAARLQSHCEPGRVLLSHATWLLVNDQMDCQPKGELTLKGIIKPVMTYEVGDKA